MYVIILMLISYFMLLLRCISELINDTIDLEKYIYYSIYFSSSAISLLFPKITIIL